LVPCFSHVYCSLILTSHFVTSSRAQYPHVWCTYQITQMGPRFLSSSRGISKLVKLYACMCISNPLDSFRSIKYKHGTQPKVTSNGILILSLKSSPKDVLRKSSIVIVLTCSPQRCS
jgi:hypothetical protein